MLPAIINDDNLIDHEGMWLHRSCWVIQSICVLRWLTLKLTLVC